MYGKGCEYKDNDCKRVALSGLFRKLSKEPSHIRAPLYIIT